MKRFLVALGIFAIPVLAYILPPIYLLESVGENFHSIDKVISKNEKYLIGYAYNEQNYDYLKWRSLVSHKKNTVVALGSSRVLQFRSNMFKTPFYNAGYTIGGLKHYIQFLESLPKEKLPDHLIVGIDQWMFNESWDRLKTNIPNDKWEKSFAQIPTIATVEEVWKDVFDGKYHFDVPTNDTSTQHIGLNAIVNHQGFRNDGSMNYGDHLDRVLAKATTESDYKYRNTLNRIATETMQFVPASHPNKNAIPEIEKLLQFCKARNIKVVGFLPPFANQVYARMKATGKFNYLSEIFPMANPVFKKYGFEFYDFSTMAACNADDTETIDGFHGGELAYLKMLALILKSGSGLNKVCDLKQLESDAQHPINKLSVYQ